MTSPKTQTTKVKQEVPKDLQTAFKIHTLAQMIHAQIASSHPWLMGHPGTEMFSPPEYWPPEVAPGNPAGAWTPWKV